MMRRPRIALSPAERAAVGTWTRRILAVWLAIVALALSPSIFGSGSDESWRQAGMARVTGAPAR